MYLVAGLGNPGEKYNLTRHNVGFVYLDYLADKFHASFVQSKWQALSAKVEVFNEQVLLLKPQTFMNLSGRSVLPAASYFKIPPEQIIVIHDDLDMPVGKVKIVSNRGSGGHNGIRSIIDTLGSKNFIRIKSGIGRPETPIPIEKYVLTKMTPFEMEKVDESKFQIYQALKYIISESVDVAMNKINSL